MHRALLLFALGGCLELSDPRPDPRPEVAGSYSACSASRAPVPAHCVPGGLAALDGAWTASGRQRSLDGRPSLGAVSFAIRFDQATADHCVDVAGERPDPISANWPDPSGTWYVTDTAATLRHASKDDEIAVFWNVCVDDRSGMLRATARSGFPNTHAGYTWVEDFAGTLAP